MGIPKSEKKFVFWKLEIFAEFTGEITYPNKNGGDTTRKFHVWAAPGQTKTTVARKLLLRHDRLKLTLVVNKAL